MRLTLLSLEELENLELTLQENEPKSEHGNYSMLIKIYEEMYRRLVPLARKNKEQYGAELYNIKEPLIFYLIKYGTYLKMNNVKDDELARSSLQRALKYDPTNPIAYYRLGFLSYKDTEYRRSVHYFQSTLTYQDSHIKKRISVK
ncbi:tetratricopeptide repeat protein [Bacillus sp. JJ1503]|uniref:tetratricopeptide repeat protein n=1 Tax=Bacillus sp. JJ1503 TaxID=3122956 RepID=UPI002FFEABE5